MPPAGSRVSKGDYFNVVGLPIARTVALIAEACHKALMAADGQEQRQTLF